MSSINQLLEINGIKDDAKNAFHAGYEGNVDELDKLTPEQKQFYCAGAAAAGRKSLVSECITTHGCKPDAGLFGAAWGGHMEIVKLMLEKGADPDEGLRHAEDPAIKALLIKAGAKE